VADERYKTPSSVFVMLFRNKNGSREILLQKRKNTGYMDGYWDSSAGGHVEAGESLTSTAVLETKEELSINVEPQHMKFAMASYNNFRGTVYCYFYFLIEEYEGTVSIGNKEKCEEIAWFNVDSMPQGMIPDREESIKNWLDGKIFNEFGWNRS
jgi:ADP-ribose pyrophosphatase YjhB (NUDIX family)